MKIIRQSIEIMKLQDDCDSFKGITGPVIGGACCLSGSCCQSGACCKTC